MFLLAEDREDVRAMVLTNEVLVQKLKSLVAAERRGKASFLGFLAEVDARQYFLALAYGSLFEFCVEELGLSESTALKRIQVARAARKLPVLYSVIESGKMSVTALSKLVPHINHENATELLKECEKKSVRHVELILAGHFPEKDVPDSIQKARTKALCSNRSSILFSASNEFIKKLEKAKALLSHKFPEQKLDDVFGESLDLLIDKLTPKKTDVPKVKEHQGNSSRSRYIPRFIRGEAWQRHEAQCAYVSSNGRRCTGKAFLEYDHATAYANGGSSHDPGNIRLLCSNHNKYLARITFPWAWDQACASLSQG